MTLRGPPVGVESVVMGFSWSCVGSGTSWASVVVESGAVMAGRTYLSSVIGVKVTSESSQ